MQARLRGLVTLALSAFLAVGSFGCTPSEQQQPTNPELKVPDIPPSSSGGGGRPLPKKQ